MTISNEELRAIIQSTVGEIEAVRMIKNMFPERAAFTDLKEDERVTLKGALYAVKAQKRQGRRNVEKMNQAEHDAARDWLDKWLDDL